VGHRRKKTQVSTAQGMGGPQRKDATSVKCIGSWMGPRGRCHKFQLQRRLGGPQRKDANCIGVGSAPEERHHKCQLHRRLGGPQRKDAASANCIEDCVDPRGKMPQVSTAYEIVWASFLALCSATLSVAKIA
jgi:hypothetical protein